MDFDYADDPFAGDNDDLCYAEILIPSDANTPQKQGSPSGQRDARRTSQHRHTDPYAYSTPDANDMLREARRDSQLEEDSVPPEQRQRVVAQRPRSRSESIRGSVADVDPEEIAATYDDMLQSLRSEVSRLQEENNSLYSSQSKLESQLRKVTLENEDMEWRYRQLQERSALLEERISTMQQDLAYAQEERKEQRQLEAHRVRTETASAAAQPSTRNARAAPATMPVQAAREEPQSQSHVDPVAVVPEVPAAAQQRTRPKPSPPPFATTPEPSAARASQPRTAAQTANLTERQKEQEYRSNVQSVEKLEAELLQHCQKRDELMGTIQRLERVRTIADRAKKAAAETDLEEEDRAIGHIRLQLRSQAFLHK